MIAVEFFLRHYFHCNCNLNNSTRHDISNFPILRNYTNLKKQHARYEKHARYGNDYFTLLSHYIRFNCYVLYENHLKNIIRTGIKDILLNFSSFQKMQHARYINNRDVVCFFFNGSTLRFGINFYLNSLL